MPDVTNRRTSITKLIKKYRIRTQGRLIDLLEEEEGIKVTQATVSRDIARLNLIKVGGVYALPPSGEQHLEQPDLTGKIIDVIPAGDNLIVVRTPIGEAGAVGAALDRSQIPAVAGTLAGDDTVFVACLSAAGARDILQRLRSFLPYSR